jgi:hypothetical protein
VPLNIIPAFIFFLNKPTSCVFRPWGGYMPLFQMELSSQMLRYDRVTFSHSHPLVLKF